MKNQLHVYADEELYSRCAILAHDLGLSNSSYVKMLVSKAWKERKGEGFIVVDQKLTERKEEGFTKTEVEASKVPAVEAVRYSEIGKSRQRHKSKIRKE